LTASSAALGLRPDIAQAAESRKKSIKLGISTLFLLAFPSAQKSPIETVIEKAAVIGVSGVDILHRQMDLEEKGAVRCRRPRLLQQTQAPRPSRMASI